MKTLPLPEKGREKETGDNGNNVEHKAHQSEWRKPGTIATSIIAIVVVVNLWLSVFGGTEERLMEAIRESETRVTHKMERVEDRTSERLNRFEGRIEKRFDKIESRFERLEGRINESNQRISRIEGRLER